MRAVAIWGGSLEGFPYRDGFAEFILSEAEGLAKT
jgi:hypothetical protein